MIVHTLQRASLISALYAEGELLTDERCVFPPAWDSEEWRRAYGWMRDTLTARVPGYPGTYPWWAWRIIHGECKPPNVRDRTSYHWAAPGAHLVRITLDVPDAEVVLTDFSLWHFPLNRGAVSLNEAEADEFEKLPVSDVMWTWDRLILPSAHAFDPEWQGPIGNYTQACFGVLRVADVRAITPFSSRPVRWMTPAGEGCSYELAGTGEGASDQ